MAKNKNTKKVLNDNWDEILVMKKAGTSVSAIARKFNISPQTLSARFNKKVKTVDEIPTYDTMAIKKVSTRYDGDGNIKSQWVQEASSKAAELEAFEQAAKDLSTTVKPGFPVFAPEITNNDLLTNYIVTDMHLGLLAHASESGKDVDSKIVYANTVTAMKLLIDSSPDSALAILTDIGDTLHSADDANRTKSGHQLDTDGRHAKIFSMAVQLKIEMLELALAKHSKVKYMVVAGNHSDMVGIYLKAVIDARFKDEPRLEVEMSTAIHQYHHFGKVLLGYTHSHTSSPAKLPGVMTVDNIEIISDTRYRFFHCGHYHSAKVLDDPLCFVETHRNLTNNDFYSQSAGFRTNKEMKSITYHKDYGEWSRNIAPLALVEDYLRN